MTERKLPIDDDFPADARLYGGIDVGLDTRLEVVGVNFHDDPERPRVRLVLHKPGTWRKRIDLSPSQACELVPLLARATRAELSPTDSPEARARMDSAARAMETSKKGPTR